MCFIELSREHSGKRWSLYATLPISWEAGCVSCRCRYSGGRKNSIFTTGVLTQRVMLTPNYITNCYILAVYEEFRTFCYYQLCHILIFGLQLYLWIMQKDVIVFKALLSFLNLKVLFSVYPIRVFVSRDSVVCIATRYGLDASRRDFLHPSDRPQGPPNLI